MGKLEANSSHRLSPQLNSIGWVWGKDINTLEWAMFSITEYVWICLLMKNYFVNLTKILALVLFKAWNGIVIVCWHSYSADKSLSSCVWDPTLLTRQSRRWLGREEPTIRAQAVSRGFAKIHFTQKSMDLLVIDMTEQWD